MGGFGDGMAFGPWIEDHIRRKARHRGGRLAGAGPRRRRRLPPLGRDDHRRLQLLRSRSPTPPPRPACAPSSTSRGSATGPTCAARTEARIDALDRPPSSCAPACRRTPRSPSRSTTTACWSGWPASAGCRSPRTCSSRPARRCTWTSSATSWAPTRSRSTSSSPIPADIELMAAPRRAGRPLPALERAARLRDRPAPGAARGRRPRGARAPTRPSSAIDFDMWAEMRAAIMHARARLGRADALSARAALELATTGGAAALGLGAADGHAHTRQGGRHLRARPHRLQLPAVGRSGHGRRLRRLMRSRRPDDGGRRDTLPARIPCASDGDRRQGQDDPRLETMLFERIRRGQKPVFIFLAVMFGLGFVALGVGSGAGGINLGDILNTSSGGSGRRSRTSPVQDARASKRRARLAASWPAPTRPTGRPTRAIGAYLRYVALRPKDQSGLSGGARSSSCERGGRRAQLTKAQALAAQYTTPAGCVGRAVAEARTRAHRTRSAGRPGAAVHDACPDPPVAAQLGLPPGHGHAPEARSASTRRTRRTSSRWPRMRPPGSSTRPPRRRSRPISTSSRTSTRRPASSSSRR